MLTYALNRYLRRSLGSPDIYVIVQKSVRLVTIECWFVVEVMRQYLPTHHEIEIVAFLWWWRTNGQPAGQVLCVAGRGTAIWIVVPFGRTVFPAVPCAS